MRVLRTCVDTELLHLSSTELVMRDHTANSLLNSTLRVLSKKFTVRNLLQTTRETGVAVSELLIQLVTSNGDLVSVNNDDEITLIKVRRESRLMLPTK